MIDELLTPSEKKTIVHRALQFGLEHDDLTPALAKKLRQDAHAKKGGHKGLPMALCQCADQVAALCAVDPSLRFRKVDLDGKQKEVGQVLGRSLGSGSQQVTHNLFAGLRLVRPILLVDYGDGERELQDPSAALLGRIAASGDFEPLPPSQQPVRAWAARWASMLLQAMGGAVPDWDYSLDLPA